MAKLLCTLGGGVLVAAEAFDFPGVAFDEVHCFTSDSSFVQTEVLHQFFAQYPDVKFSLTRLVGFENLNDEREHSHFQEGLWRWYLSHLDPEDLPYICVAGGFKSMSTALQKAAQLFGAAQVFHVLCDTNPQTLEELDKARKENRIRFVNLGPEAGWEHLQNLREAYRFSPSEDFVEGDQKLQIEGKHSFSASMRMGFCLVGCGVSFGSRVL